MAAGTQAFTFDGTLDGGWFGASLATARDASGGFLKDLLVGAPGDSVTSTTIKGSVYLYEFPTMLDAGSLGSAIPGVVIGAGVSTGAPGITGSPPVGFIATAHRLPHGLEFGDLFGQSVAFVGSLDGVAGQEFLVGAPQYASESGSPTTKGTGYVQLFRKSSVTPLITICGTQGPCDMPRQEGEAFGFSVAGGVDLNVPPDAVPDLLIGAPLFNVDATGPGTGFVKAGRVRAYSVGFPVGSDPVVTPLLVDSPEVNGTIMFGTAGSDQFGYSVTGMPDINGDGSSDVLAGAWQGAIASATVCIPPQDPPLRTASGGYANLYTSGGLLSPPSKLVTFYGEAFRDHLGRAVAAEDLFGTSSRPEIVLTGVAWNVFGAVDPDPTEYGRGYVWNGDTLFP